MPKRSNPNDSQDDHLSKKQRHGQELKATLDHAEDKKHEQDQDQKDYSQGVLVKKFESFLKNYIGISSSSSLIKPVGLIPSKALQGDMHHIANALITRMKEREISGLCFGLSLLLGIHFLSGNEPKEYYDYFKSFMKFKKENLYQYKKNLLTTLGLLDYAHFPFYHTKGRVNQSDIKYLIKQISGMHVSVAHEEYYFTADEFFQERLMRLEENTFMIISSFLTDDSGHAIVAYLHKDLLWFFDPNDENFQPLGVSKEKVADLFYKMMEAFVFKQGKVVPETIVNFTVEGKKNIRFLWMVDHIRLKKNSPRISFNLFSHEPKVKIKIEPLSDEKKESLHPL